MGLSIVEERRGRAAADELLRQALALDPNDPETLDGISQRLFATGYFREALRLREQLRLLEPFVPIFAVTTASYIRSTGQNEAAIRILEAAPSNGEVGERRALWLAMAYAEAGRYDEAADMLLAIPADQNRTSKESAAVAARLLRQAPAKVSAPESLPKLDGNLNFVYAHIGAPDRVFELAEEGIEVGVPLLGLPRLWDPLSAPLRKTERFKAIVRQGGLVDYWRARGWPDLCRPVGADDFVCD